MVPVESIIDLAAAVRKRKRSAAEIAQECLDRIQHLDSRLNAFHETYAHEAIQRAKAIDGRTALGEDPGLLAGVPFAVKDNIVTDFGHTTCGSRILEHYKSPYCGTAVRRLLNAGAVIIGKTNCDEFAMGSSTEHCAFGPTHNPWDVDRVPGGSSGGSAAAVAAGLCPAALGSDTGGSIRQPASFCGIVGVKPSYGRVSRYGLVAYGSSLDQIGPLAATVRDAAAVLNVIAGVDQRDSTSSDAFVPNYLSAIGQSIEGMRIGVPRQYLSDRNDAAVNDALRRGIRTFTALGAQIIDVDLPLTEFGIATYYVIAPAEASSNLARYDGIRYGRRATLDPGETLFDLYSKSRTEGFGQEVQRRIMLGTYVLSAGYYDAYYKRALQVRRLIKQEFDQAFMDCHALLGPTAPTSAFPIGTKPDPLEMYMSDVYTVNANIAGICGISIPGGFAAANGTQLPIGLQLLCQAFDEVTMFRIAHAFEKATDYHTKQPPASSAISSI